MKAKILISSIILISLTFKSYASDGLCNLHDFEWKEKYPNLYKKSLNSEDNLLSTLDVFITGFEHQGDYGTLIDWLNKFSVNFPEYKNIPEIICLKEKANWSNYSKFILKNISEEISTSENLSNQLENESFVASIKNIENDIHVTSEDKLEIKKLIYKKNQEISNEKNKINEKDELNQQKIEKKEQDRAKKLMQDIEKAKKDAEKNYEVNKKQRDNNLSNLIKKYSLNKNIPKSLLTKNTFVSNPILGLSISESLTGTNKLFVEFLDLLNGNIKIEKTENMIIIHQTIFDEMTKITHKIDYGINYKNNFSFSKNVFFLLVSRLIIDGTDVSSERNLKLNINLSKY